MLFLYPNSTVVSHTHTHTHTCIHVQYMIIYHKMNEIMNEYIHFKYILIFFVLYEY